MTTAGSNGARRACRKCGSTAFLQTARGVVCELGHLQELPAAAAPPAPQQQPAPRPEEPRGEPEAAREPPRPEADGAQVPPAPAGPVNGQGAPRPPEPPAAPRAPAVQAGLDVIANGEIEGRVVAIAQLMADGAWTVRKARELATRWGVTEKTVRNLTGEASRRVYAAGSFGDLFARRVSAVAKAEMLFVLAVNDARGHPDRDGNRTMKPNPRSLRTALAALELQARLEGLLAHEQTRTAPGLPAAGASSLPSELATLQPPPSVAELEHYIATPTDDDCNVIGCRIHTRRGEVREDPED